MIPAIAIVAVCQSYTLDEIINAIGQVESGNNDNIKDGDNGRSIGRYQIQRAYWRDAALHGVYGSCRQKSYAKSVLIAYWKRYEPKAVSRCDAEALAMVHNHGPSWRLNKRATDEYWRKVQKQLKRKGMKQ